MGIFKGNFGEKKGVIDTALTIGAAIGTLIGVGIGGLVLKKVANPETDEVVEEDSEEVTAEIETTEEEEVK